VARELWQGSCGLVLGIARELWARLVQDSKGGNCPSTHTRMFVSQSPQQLYHSASFAASKTAQPGRCSKPLLPFVAVQPISGHPKSMKAVTGRNWPIVTGRIRVDLAVHITNVLQNAEDSVRGILHSWVKYVLNAMKLRHGLLVWKRCRRRRRPRSGALRDLICSPVA